MGSNNAFFFLFLMSFYTCIEKGVLDVPHVLCMSEAL